MKNPFAIILLILIVTTVQAQKKSINLLVGTYTNSCDSKGIYVYEFDSNKGDFKLKSTSESTVNPSYLTLSNENDVVYAVNENGDKSTVSAFSFDSKTGKLALINKQNSNGADPCYIINDNKNVIVANYSGGNIVVFGKNSDGSLDKSKQVVNHFGKSVNIQRQESSHVHMVYFSPGKKYVLANDLGTDSIYIYSYDATKDSDVLILKDTIAVEKGSGPRHLTFSKDGKFVYVLQELNGGLTTFSYTNGTLKKIAENTILDKDYKGTFSAADIHLSPNGKFLYASNRGDANTISIFRVHNNGTLEPKGQTSALGKGPRNFAIDPSGKFLLVGHHYSNEIVIFKINKSNGSLTDTGKKIAVCAPVCLVFGK